MKPSKTYKLDLVSQKIIFSCIVYGSTINILDNYLSIRHEWSIIDWRFKNNIIVIMYDEIENKKLGFK